MNIACPHCQGLMVGDGIAPGSPVLCPHCQNQFTMSAPAAPTAPAPRPQPQAPQYPPTGPPQGPVGLDPVRSAGPGPVPGAGPAPGVAPAPARDRSQPGPAVQAVWSDVGRRSKGVDSSKMMLGVGISVLILGVIVVIFVVVLNARPKAEPGTGPRSPDADIVTLDANIKCSPTEVTVKNMDAFEWTNVVVRINSDGSKGGYSHKVVERRMKGGIYVALPYNKFVNSSGTTFDTAGEGVRSVFIEADTSAGRGRCTAVLQ